MSLRSKAISAALVLLAVLADFGLFLTAIPRTVPDPQIQADGIAVLTGARERIGLAARLLEEGRGKRLLISGVNERTNLADVLRIDPALERFSACCIDIGRKATNTIGNAQEINQWARQYTYQRIILVTSDYHMPRAALEAEHANPGLTFIRWPVPSSHDGKWLKPSDVMTWRLIFSEWAKLHVVVLRIAFGLPVTDND